MRPAFGYLAVCSISLLAGVRAQSVLPNCALSCINVGLGQTSCPQTDTRCLCQSSGYIDTSTTCVRSLCNKADAESAAQYAISNCALVGIQVSIPGFTSTATSASATGASRTPSTTSTGAATKTASGGSASSSSSGSETPASTSEGSSGNPTSAPSSGGSSTNVGAIVGGVVGGIVALAALGIFGFWLLKRERRKKLEMEMAMGGVPPKQPMAADPNSQSIWAGDNTYSWNPQTNTHDVHGGTPVDR